MLSMPGRGVRPRVTVVPACSRAEFSTPASARLRVTHAACAVFHATKRVVFAGASDETNRCDAGAGIGRVQADAGFGVGVVGDLRAPVHGQRTGPTRAW